MIKNKFKLVSILAALLLAGCVTATPALAVDEITYNADTTVALTGQDITILSGSQATDVIVNATNLDITLTNPDVFTVRSANRYTFTIGGGPSGTYLTSCGSTFSEVSINPASGVTETTVTITPTTTVCSSVSGGGGGGGGTADTTAPANASVAINAGSTVTNTTSVTLTLSATDSVGVTQMQISNDSAFTGATWETYATSKAWTLTSGNGTKTVYARFRDAASNTSATVSDTITLDSTATDVTAPSLPSVSINAGAATTASTSVTLTLGATDATGVTQMQVSNDVNFTGAVWETFMTSRSWTLVSGDGTKTVYAKFRDAAGNVSATASDSITLSTGTPPTQAQVIAQLQAQINALILQINALISAQGGTPPASCSAPLTRQMNFGVRHAEVVCLQNFLKANGYMSASIPSTGYFGTLTRAAVQAFQAQKGIVSAGGYGYGHVGPKTRASINAMLGF